jgi:aminoglycoside 3-N-acetyltransferase
MKSRSVRLPSRAPATKHVTQSDLTTGLRAVGIGSGDIMLVHASLGSLGLIIGGPQAIVNSLTGAVGPEGTVMFPTFSSEKSDPVDWWRPPVPEEWHENIRDALPPYDPDTTPTEGVGSVSEYFRNMPGVVRSQHPTSSFAALGPAAESLVRAHEFDYRFGPNSPLEKLVELGGKVLQFGAPPESMSLYHYTQYLVGWRRKIEKRSPVLSNKKKKWTAYNDVIHGWKWFSYVTDHLVDCGVAQVSEVCGVKTTIYPAKETVDAIVDWRRERGV